MGLHSRWGGVGYYNYLYAPGYENGKGEEDESQMNGEKGGGLGAVGGCKCFFFYQCLGVWSRLATDSHSALDNEWRLIAYLVTWIQEATAGYRLHYIIFPTTCTIAIISEFVFLSCNIALEV